MLLKFLRKRLKIILIVLLAFIIVPFLFWGMSSYTRQKGSEEEAKYYLRGKPVSRPKFMQAYIDTRTQLIIDFVEANNITAEKFNLYQSWLNQLLQRTDLNRLALQQLLLQEESRKYGLFTTRKEVAKWIEEFPLFKRNGHFDMEIYEALVKSLFNSWPTRFEQSLTRILTIKKLQDLILDTVLVSSDEAYEAYKERNEKAVIYYTEFNSNDYTNKVTTPEKEELETYYSKYKEKFREPEKIKIAYLAFDPETLRDKIKEPGPKEIEDYYKSNQKEFKDENGNLRELDKVKDEIIEKLIKEKAAELAQERALETSIELTEEKRIGDMHKLAKDKGWTVNESKFISKNEFIPELGWSPQLTKIVWEMDVETISDLIRVDNKWVIASPVEKKSSHIPELSNVEAQVTEQVKRLKAEEIAYRDAQITLAKLPKDLPFTMAVKSIGLKAIKSKPVPKTHPIGKTAFSKEDNPVRTPSGSIIYSIRKFYPVEPEKWEEEKERFTKSYLEEKKMRFYKKWLENLLSSS